MKLRNNKNLNVLVDEDISKDITDRSWCIIYKREIPYVVTGQWMPDLKRTKIIYLHRLIMNLPQGKYVDHINGDTLDNRKSNLRVCNNADNLRNRGKNKNNTLGYKGVGFRKDLKTKPFTATITVNKKTIHLGYYETAVDAAKAYDVASKKYHKNFGKLNFMEKS